MLEWTFMFPSCLPLLFLIINHSFISQVFLESALFQGCARCWGLKSEQNTCGFYPRELAVLVAEPVPLPGPPHGSPPSRSHWLAFLCPGGGVEEEGSGKGSLGSGSTRGVGSELNHCLQAPPGQV